jgi:hypothetical protein
VDLADKLLPTIAGTGLSKTLNFDCRDGSSNYKLKLRFIEYQCLSLNAPIAELHLQHDCASQQEQSYPISTPVHPKIIHPDEPYSKLPKNRTSPLNPITSHIL